MLFAFQQSAFIVNDCESTIKEICLSIGSIIKYSKMLFVEMDLKQLIACYVTLKSFPIGNDRALCTLIIISYAVTAKSMKRLLFLSEWE